VSCNNNLIYYNNNNIDSRACSDFLLGEKYFKKIRVRVRVNVHRRAVFSGLS